MVSSRPVLTIGFTGMDISIGRTCGACHGEGCAKVRLVGFNHPNLYSEMVLGDVGKALTIKPVCDTNKQCPRCGGVGVTVC